MMTGLDVSGGVIMQQQGPDSRVPAVEEPGL